MRAIGILWFALTLIAFGMGSNVQAQTDSREELFFSSNQSYKNGDFQKAGEGYSQLIAEGHKSGQVYYNLGNAYFKMNDLGRAILNYERAFLQTPRDADLKFNLNIAQDQTRDAIPNSQNFSGLLFAWLDSINLNELFWSFALINASLWINFLSRLFIKTELTYYLVIILIIFWLGTGVSLGVKSYQIRSDSRAVVLDKEIGVYAGPDVSDTILFKLHQGTIVHHERTEDGWSLIRLSDEKRGWVKHQVVERIQN